MERPISNSRCPPSHCIGCCHFKPGNKRNGNFSQACVELRSPTSSWFCVLVKAQKWYPEHCPHSNEWGKCVPTELFHGRSSGYTEDSAPARRSGRHTLRPEVAITLKEKPTSRAKALCPGYGKSNPNCCPHKLFYLTQPAANPNILYLCFHTYSSFSILTVPIPSLYQHYPQAFLGS